jgi:signal transduction histidine kinase
LAAGLVAALLTAGVAQPVSPDEPWPWAVTTVGALGVVLMVGATVVRDRRTLVGAWVLTVGLGAVLVVADPDRGPWGGLAYAAVALAAALVVGDALGGRLDAIRRLDVEREVGEVERARRVLLEERARIARDLHDIVAHHMSLVAVQAESVRYRLDGVPDDVADELSQIARVAREALEESRRLLAVLRHDPATGQGLHPQPGRSQLGELVEQTCRAGTPVTPEISLDDELPRGVELAIYRITQEALSNVVRHAPGAATSLTLVACDGQVVLTVDNARAAGGHAAAPGLGHGLLGVRERAALVGGSAEAGPTAEGGWRVRAVLPAHSPASTPAPGTEAG